MVASDELARLRSRPSPPYHASELSPGVRRSGNDGLMYEVVRNAKGIQQWKPSPQAKERMKNSQHTLTLVLRPSLRADEEDEEEQRGAKKKGAKEGMKGTRLEHSKIFGSARAMVIAWQSLGALLMATDMFEAGASSTDVGSCHVASVRYVPSDPPQVHARTGSRYSASMKKLMFSSSEEEHCPGYYAVEIRYDKTSMRRKITEDAREIYGDLSFDTWKEDDMSVKVTTGGHTMDLDLTLEGVQKDAS